MVFETPEVLKISLVLIGLDLLNDQDGVNEFLDSVGSEVSVESLAGVVLSHQAATVDRPVRFKLDKDRLSVDILQHASWITKEYPEKGDLQRLAEVASLAIAKTDLENNSPTSLGYTIELIHDQNSSSTAISYLSERMFTENFLGNEEWKIVGGMGTLMIERNGQRLLVNLEPRFKDELATKVFITLGMYIPDAEVAIPDESEINEKLLETWSQAHVLIESLDSYEKA